MFRDIKLFRRDSGKNQNSDEVENLPTNPNGLPPNQPSSDITRDPLLSIPEPTQISKPGIEKEAGLKSRIETTPTKPKVRGSDTSSLRTPDKQGNGTFGKNRFGWSATSDARNEMANYLGQSSRNGGSLNMTPRVTRANTVGRANSSHSESSSVQTTPTKSVSKPPYPATGSYSRTGTYATLSRGLPICNGPPTVVNTVEVPHFDLKEDPSFWMDHNVQVIIRVRPLNNAERSSQGYNRCVKQESPQNITWIGQPEARFTFDHVACETVDQEMLFRMAGLPMVENCLSGYNSCMFAYGQTGSGKTYTMLGDLDDLEFKPSSHRGMTPRIFEFLFARIRAEEESRKDEKLKYSCKCSFLEIYNEQVTDLLNPSSANLLLREDVRKGVYVENLSEFEVHSVGDILSLLAQGSSNRKVAATNMNKESSRSHSVFTCVIESKWERDSTTNLRFARLNLVDLAGSERQKTSGAEGERLKEAANINKSLSTLGHVIMVLVDVANGKIRHVPYRDSRLTFLLQDSLGGNSKTIIIANISPSVCCAAETLNTLKFAQRAKLIQNNAIVNEDSSGDVSALQHQIRLLKEELSALKRQHFSRSLSFGPPTIQYNQEEQEDVDMEIDEPTLEDSVEFEAEVVKMSSEQLKSLDKMVAGALRREHMAETSIKKLEAEIEHLNRLVHQREEDTRCSKMQLKFREDKIRRMESLIKGAEPVDSYLLEENAALSEEIQMLQAKVERNPEVTRFALENIRLLEQLKRFQDFYEEGEREILLSEVSELRDKLIQLLEEKNKQQDHSKIDITPQELTKSNEENDSLCAELNKTRNQLEECQSKLRSCLENNISLKREIDELHLHLHDVKPTVCSHDNTTEEIKGSKVLEQNAKHGCDCENVLKSAEELLNLELELDILKIILKEERSSRVKADELANCLSRELKLAEEVILSTRKQYEDVKDKLKEANSVIEALESQQMLSISEIEDLKNKNRQHMELLHIQELELAALNIQNCHQESNGCSTSKEGKCDETMFQLKLSKMQASLEKAKRLNLSYQRDHALQKSDEEEMDEIHRQVEAETAQVILCLQEELSTLQQQEQESAWREKEVQSRLMLLETTLTEQQEAFNALSRENEALQDQIKEKEKDIGLITAEWELLSGEVEAVLTDGHEALIDASDQLETICSHIPRRGRWISEQVHRLIKHAYDKELVIEELNLCLENANARLNDMECMLRSLKGAALVITESHQKECSEKEREILSLRSELSAKTSAEMDMEHKISVTCDEMRKASKCATVAFIIVNRLLEINSGHLDALRLTELQLKESLEANQMKEDLLSKYAAASEEDERQIQALKKELELSEESCSSLEDKLTKQQMYISVMERRLDEYDELDIMKTKEKLSELKVGVSKAKSCMDNYARQCVNQSKKDGSEILELVDGSTDAWLDAAENQEEYHVYCNSVGCPRDADSRSNSEACSNTSIHEDGKENETSTKTCKAGTKDATITLLRKEIESAMESLKEVQAEIVRLQAENKEISTHEKQSREGMGTVMAQVCSLQAAFGDFEEQCLLKLQALNQKFQKVEQDAVEAGGCLYEAKEFFDAKLNNATLDIAQRTAEAACLLSNFEEAQDIMKEADVIIKGLMIANETMKLEIEDLKSENRNLSCERDSLVQDVQHLHSYSANNQQCYQLLEELEILISEVQAASEEAVLSMAHDICSIKSEVRDSSRLIQSWLEDVWSEIIVKDSAMSVLHLCHMGILLESVTGLNAENCLLNNGLCESNAMISLLREQNMKSVQELETCNMLKGKLLADIKRSFDRITRKEDETEELSAKLRAFETKITDLQLQEELMLERSNSLGFELANLVKDLNESNSNALTSLLEQEKLLNDTREATASEAENLITEVTAKDIELMIMASELQQMVDEKANMETKQIGHCKVLENLKKEFVTLWISSNMIEHLLMERNAEVDHLQKEVEEANMHATQSYADLTYMDVLNTALKEELLLQSEIALLNEKLKYELHEASEDKEKLSNQLQNIEIEYSNLGEKVIMLERELGLSSGQATVLDQQNQDLLNEVKMKDELLNKMKFLEEANHSLMEELDELKSQNSLLIKDFMEKDSEVKSSEGHIENLKVDNSRLQESIHDLGLKISFLQEDLDSRKAHLEGLQCSNTSTNEELHRKKQELQENFMKISALEEEKLLFKDELRSLKLSKFESLSLSSCNGANCLNLVKAAEMHSYRMYTLLNERTEIILYQLSEDSCENLEMVAKIKDALESLDTIINDTVSENFSLQTELLRKDEVLNGLLFDLSLLQESASNTKDQKDEIEELMASLNSMEDELKTRTCELDYAVAHSHELEAQMTEKIDTISLLEKDLSTATHAVEMLSKEKADLMSHMEEILASKVSMERELTEKMKLIDSLETEILDMENSIAQMNGSMESLKSELDDVSTDRDHFHKELLLVEEKLDTAQELAQEYEAIAMEAKQIAESRRIYGEEKEEEVKLLEKSVEELDRTVNIMENKVDILKEEAERQRLQREELELELHSLKTQMDNLRSADSDIKRKLEEKEINLQMALKQVQNLEKDLANKDTEIAHCKAHITELNLHAEAQASEYKKKFKALEAMAEQVKPEGPSSHGKSSSSNKLEKNASKPRGSGSPFKCIGLGLAQQLKLEKDEEITAERLRIQELEALAANRQKEIFVLNNRLAAAESMTHDVIRDLLGVKLDMTNYVSLLDKQQVRKIAENAQLDNVESEVKVEEINKLKKLLSDFVEERKGWLEEIDRKQGELFAAQLALEKLHQKDRSLTAENEVLKVEVGNYKRKIAELEGEVNKLSGQQNLHQRIHHHAKIKEENNILKSQNEDLSARLQKAETFLMRVKEELVRVRACNGKIPCIDFDEEKRLSNKLKETEGQRIQLAQDLLGLCTSILKAAGIKKPTSDINVSSAEEALEQLRSRITSLERELENLKLKSRIANERMRISEFIPHSPPTRSRAEDNCLSPRRASQSPFFSALDR